MNIERIITKRHQKNLFWWELVFEWEEYFNEQLHSSYFYESPFLSSKIARYFSKVTKNLLPRKKAFVFEMGPSSYRIYNKSNIIPLIIDFYPKDELLPGIIKSYSNNPLILISSKQVYDYLVNIGFPIPLRHLPLSLPDKYLLSADMKFEKKIDLVQVGRISDVMLQYTEEYAKRHPKFVYVRRKWENGHNVYYDSKGRLMGIFDSREEYWTLIRMSRTAIYTTSGMDDDKKTGSDFHQVTPRFLELLAAGCHVICRYQKNSDTDYYELEKFSKSVDSYEEFENQLDMALSREVDVNMYSEYLKKHITSTRVNQLKSILNYL